MNWYKTSQLYEDIDRSEYEDDWSYRADQYFSIGQNEETTKDSYCWIFMEGRLLVGESRTHNVHFRHLFNDKTYRMDDVFKGWYDPVQEMVSVVVPRGSGDYLEGNKKEVPSVLMRQLHQKFGDNFEVQVF